MENIKYNTKALVEAGLLSAITVVLMLITIYVPVLDMVGTFLLPVPITLMYIRHDFKITLTGIAASALIVAVLFNPIKAVSLAIMFGLTGLTLGYCIKKDKKPTTTIMLLSIATIIVLFLNIVLTALIIEKTTIGNSLHNMIVSISEAGAESIKTVKSTYIKMGAPEEIMKQLDVFVERFDASFLMNMLGGMLISGAVISAFVNFVVVKAILVKLGYKVRSLPVFSELYIDSFVGIFIVLPVFIGTFLKSKNIAVGTTIMFSGNMIMQLVFLVIGVSVLTYFLKNKYKLSKGIIIAIALFMSLNSLFAMILTYIGLVDMIFDFRKINPNRVRRR